MNLIGTAYVSSCEPNTLAYCLYLQCLRDNKGIHSLSSVNSTDFLRGRTHSGPHDWALLLPLALKEAQDPGMSLQSTVSPGSSNWFRMN